MVIIIYIYVIYWVVAIEPNIYNYLYMLNNIQCGQMAHPMLIINLNS